MAAAKTNRRNSTGSPCRDRTDDRLKREHFLHPNSDQIDLNLLLQAVLDINEKLNDKQAEKMEEGVRTTASQNDWGEVVEKEKDFDDTASRRSSMSTASRSRPRSAVHLNESRRPPPLERKNMSFSNAKVDAIDRENQRLLKQITRTRGRPKSAQPRKLLSEPLRVQTSSEVNRYRFQRKVDMENQVRDRYVCLHLLWKERNIWFFTSRYIWVRKCRNSWTFSVLTNCVQVLFSVSRLRSFNEGWNSFWSKFCIIKQRLACFIQINYLLRTPSLSKRV